MTEWERLVEKAKENLERRAFTVESDRELGEQTSLRVIGTVDQANGKKKYRVVEEPPQDTWY